MLSYWIAQCHTARRWRWIASLIVAFVWGSILTIAVAFWAYSASTSILDFNIRIDDSGRTEVFQPGVFEQLGPVIVATSILVAVAVVLAFLVFDVFVGDIGPSVVAVVGGSALSIALYVWLALGASPTPTSPEAFQVAHRLEVTGVLLLTLLPALLGVLTILWLATRSRRSLAAIDHGVGAST